MVGSASFHTLSISAASVKLSSDEYSLNIAGVAFLKAVPEGTYDAVIVDSSDPIGKILYL